MATPVGPTKAGEPTPSSSQPPPTSTNSQPLDYSRFLRPSNSDANLSKVELLPVKLDHGEPMIQFTMEEVNNFTREEGLHQAAVMKFSYGKPDIQEIRKTFSSQFDVQGHCNIGQLEFRHVLVRFDLFDDYVKFLSKSIGYFKFKGEEFFFRTFPWTLGFSPKAETSMAVVWISLPGLPPNFFAKRSLMSIASAVGKALAVDKATQDRTRPSAARVKVILDLLEKRPKRVKLQIIDKVTGKYIVYYQEVVYDNLPKYCNVCKHQGHDENMCRFLKEQSGEELIVENVTVDGNVDKLQGDAREFLNAKRAGQIQVEKAAKPVRDEQQHMVQFAAPKNASAGIVTDRATDEDRANVTVQAGVDKEWLNTKGATTVVDRVANASDSKHGTDRANYAEAQDAQITQADGNLNKEAYNSQTISKRQQQADAGQTSAKATAGQILENENAENFCLELKNNNDRLIEDNKGGVSTKSNGEWKVVTRRKSPVGVVNDRSFQSIELPKTANAGGPVAENLENYGDLAAAVPEIEVQKIGSAVQNCEIISNQMVRYQRDGKELQSNVKSALEIDARPFHPLKLSNPHVEEIIKKAQIEMMMHPIITKQPLVMLNTSVQEIPSQSWESHGEHGNELIQSAGSNNDVTKLRRMTSNSTCEYEDEDDHSEALSSEEEDYENGEEELQAGGSPSVTRPGSTGRQQLTSTEFARSEQQKHEIATEIDKQEITTKIVVQNAPVMTKMQHQIQLVCEQTVAADCVDINSQASNARHQQQQKQQRKGNEQQEQLFQHKNKTGQKQSVVPARALEDRRLLDVLHEEQRPEIPVATKAQDDRFIYQPSVQKMPYTNRLGCQTYEGGQEQDMPQKCKEKVTKEKDADLSPEQLQLFRSNSSNSSGDVNSQIILKKVQYAEPNYIFDALYEQYTDAKLLAISQDDHQKDQATNNLVCVKLKKNCTDEASTRGFKKNRHSKKISGDGKSNDEINVRQIPRKLAKQKKAIPTISTRSTRSQKKR